MMTSMATALWAAIPGERPESKLAALAVRLGAVYQGSCWRMSPAVRETLRGAAAALGLEPPEAPVDPSAVEGARAWTTHVVALSLRGRSRRAALEEGSLDLAMPVAGVVVTQPAAAELLEGLTPEVHRRAAVKRTLVDLWRARLQDRWPADCPDGRWERLAWLVYVGYALPPVFADQRRWEARSALAAGLQGTGVEGGQGRASPEVARKLVLGEACERLGQACRVS